MSTTLPTTALNRPGPEQEQAQDHLAPQAPATPRRQKNIGWLALSALVVVVIGIVAAFAWQLAGGRLYVMGTPSMCPSVCVGSLIGDRALSGPLHTGELITFHPPGSKELYTHEISAIFSNGMIQTRGVANPAHDPWLITRSNIVGRVVWTVWGLGWALKALPLLAVGVLSWILARARISPASRRSWDRLWLTALALIPIWVLNPLVRGVMAEVTVARGHAHQGQARVVNTGLLSAAFHPAGSGRGITLASAHIGHLTGGLTQHGVFFVRESLALPPWGWALLVAIVISPFLGYLVHVWRNDEASSTAAVGDLQVAE
jgi:hypothetical protein